MTFRHRKNYKIIAHSSGNYRKSRWSCTKHHQKHKQSKLVSRHRVTDCLTKTPDKKGSIFSGNVAIQHSELLHRKELEKHYCAVSRKKIQSLRHAQRSCTRSKEHWQHRARSDKFEKHSAKGKFNSARNVNRQDKTLRESGKDPLKCFAVAKQDKRCCKAPQSREGKEYQDMKHHLRRGRKKNFAGCADNQENVGRHTSHCHVWARTVHPYSLLTCTSTHHRNTRGSRANKAPVECFVIK